MDEVIPAIEKFCLERFPDDWWFYREIAFNYYHESTRHFIDCILTDSEPLPGLDWGLHITEMMVGTLKSARSGRRYAMTTTLDY